MRDFVKTQIKPGEQKIIRNFANHVPQAFQAYKMKSNIHSTLVSCKFKDKRLSGSQLRVAELIKEENRMQAKKEKRAEKQKLHQAEKSFFRRDRYDAQR